MCSSTSAQRITGSVQLGGMLQTACFAMHVAQLLCRAASTITQWTMSKEIQLNSSLVGAGSLQQAACSV